MMFDLILDVIMGLKPQAEFFSPFGFSAKERPEHSLS